MKVEAVHIPDAASDPKHPDHDRWVKEVTLKREVDHAILMGGTLADAERENNRLLARMEAIARHEKPAIVKPRKSRQQRMLDRAVQVREALPKKQGLTWLSSSPCGRCGLCRACFREKRILRISHMATKERDPWALRAMWEISLFLLKINNGAGEFSGMSKADARKRVEAKAEKLCDDSVKRLGAWIR